MSTTTCTYSHKTCGFGTCTLPTHPWQWGSSTCVTTQIATTTIEGEFSFPQFYIDVFVFTAGFFLFTLGIWIFGKLVRHNMPK